MSRSTRRSGEVELLTRAWTTDVEWRPIMKDIHEDVVAGRAGLHEDDRRPSPASSRPKISP